MPNNKPGSRLIKAAGAVAWRPGPDGEPEVLLVHRKKYDDWSLPKGKMEPGEPLPVTAAREVLEEGGAHLALGRRLISVRYNVGGRPKRVHYWAARVTSLDERAVPNAEVDEVAWLTAAGAVAKVSYVHDHGVLADFAARPPRTVPLILLRHAKAAAKGTWKRSDAIRPLDDSGRTDAKALADLLACFAPRPSLISSTAVRCMDTVRPLAHLTGAKIREERALYVHNHSADSRAAMTAIVRAAIASGEPTVICAHRENLPVLQEAALAALAGHPGAEIPAADLPGVPADAVAGGPVTEIPREWDDDLPTGSFWVLNVAPIPEATESAAEPESAGEPERAGEPDEPAAAPAGPAPGRRWWHIVRPRPGAGGAARSADGTPGTPDSEAASGKDTESGGATAAGDVPDAVARPGEPRRDATAGLAGVLVSADRYDLAES
jgi:8-oxo-dGTP pyrophosphatase MutT (NUDIX family)/phosphohistidine phosphatase SixA